MQILIQPIFAHWCEKWYYSKNVRLITLPEACDVNDMKMTATRTAKQVNKILINIQFKQVPTSNFKDTFMINKFSSILFIDAIHVLQT